MLLESGNYQLKGLCSWLLRCKKIPQHSANFPVDQVQQSLHFMVVIDVVRHEKLFCSFHICFSVLFCVIKTLYPPDNGHNLLNFTFLMSLARTDTFRRAHDCACSECIGIPSITFSKSKTNVIFITPRTLRTGIFFVTFRALRIVISFWS